MTQGVMQQEVGVGTKVRTRPETAPMSLRGQEGYISRITEKGNYIVMLPERGDQRRMMRPYSYHPTELEIIS